MNAPLGTTGSFGTTAPMRAMAPVTGPGRIASVHLGGYTLHIDHALRPEHARLVLAGHPLAGHGLRELAVSLRQVAASQRVSHDHLFLRAAQELERLSHGGGVFIVDRDEAAALARALLAACGQPTRFRSVVRGS